MSIISFRLRGGRLLSLHDESRQRRAKEREENRSGGFLLSLLNLPHLSTDRDSPPRINARGLTDTIAQRGSRAVGAVEIETSTSRELPRRNRKHKRLWREPWTCYRALPGVAGTAFLHS